ncbi:MAG: hypothetical protein ACM37W_00465 [Actinomycetota bacterium]
MRDCTLRTAITVQPTLNSTAIAPPLTHPVASEHRLWPSLLPVTPQIDGKYNLKDTVCLHAESDRSP